METGNNPELESTIEFSYTHEIHLNDLEPTDYKLVMRTELDGRKVKNPNYSLRAFARDLGVSHTLISLILNGKRAMSQKMMKKLFEKGLIETKAKLM